MASINDLKGVISSKNGVARSNLYRVTLPTIAGVSSSDLNILCTNATIPSRQLATYDKVIGTKNEKVVYSSVTDDVSMSFLAMNDYGARRYVEAWQRLAYDHDNYQMAYKSEYVRQITIEQLRRGASFSKGTTLYGLPINNNELTTNFVTNEQPIYTCTLFDAFPVSIDSIQLTNELDGMVQVNMQFAYTRWTSQQSSTGSVPTASTDPTRFITTRIFTE